MKITGCMLLTSAILVAAIGSGCGSFKRASEENDRLRERVLELEDENRALAGRAAELDAQLQGITADLPVSQEVRDATPHVAELSIATVSHAADTDGDGRADTLVLYVSPSDGLGRFLQMVGSLAVNAATIPVEGDAITIGRLSVSPGELRDAYRSTFLGTHYTVEVPITVTDPATQTDATVKVQFTGSHDGRIVSTQQVIDLEP